jgi:hypothetical protein
MATRSDGKKKLDAHEIDKRTEEKYDRFRKRYPEVRGKEVDFIKHWMEENILFVSIRFMDGTNFCIQYEPTVELVGVEYSDMTTGDTVILKEYFRRRDN